MPLIPSNHNKTPEHKPVYPKKSSTTVILLGPDFLLYNLTSPKHTNYVWDLFNLLRDSSTYVGYGNDTNYSDDMPV